MVEAVRDYDITGVRRSKKEARESYDRISGMYDDMSGHFEKNTVTSDSVNLPSPEAKLF